MARDLDAAADSVGGDPRKLQRLVMVQAGLRDLPAAYIIERERQPRWSRRARERQAALHRALRAGASRQRRSGPGAAADADAQIATASRRSPSSTSIRASFSTSPAASARRSIEHLQLTAAERRRVQPPAQGARRAQARARPHVLHDLDDRAAGRHLGRPVVCRPVRRAHPPSDHRAPSRCRSGNLKVELPDKRGEGDLRRLSMNFNTMTRELEHQRTRLVTANEQLSSGATSWRRCCRASRPASSASTARTASRSPAAPPSKLLGLAETELVGQEAGEAVPGVRGHRSTRRRSTRSRAGRSEAGDARSSAARSARSPSW